MAKRPTPKKRRAKSKGRNQYAVYAGKQIRKLTNKRNSPFAAVAQPRRKTGGSITKIKA